MKKLLIFALMFIGMSSAFAGDSPALKAIMSAKTYAAAESLLKTNLSELVSAEEKAKAYNKLVDLALDIYNKEQDIINKNMELQLLKPDAAQEAFDTLAYYTGAYNAVLNAVECDKYDQQPNLKGKVKPKYAEANGLRLLNPRLQLINAGQTYATDPQKVLSYYGLYVETLNAPFFQKAIESIGGDDYVGEIARFASIYAFQAGQLDKANEYCDVALKDEKVYNDAIGLKTYLMTQGLTTHEDSVACVKKLETLYQQENANENVFSTLASMYGALNDKAALNTIIADTLAKDPKCYSAWALKGQDLMNDQKYDEALESLFKALEVQPENVLMLTYVGYCYNAKARAVETDAEMKSLYAKSLPYLEKAQQLDPGQVQGRWSLPLYTCYYILYGENDSRTKRVEVLSGD